MKIKPLLEAHYAAHAAEVADRYQKFYGELNRLNTDETIWAMDFGYQQTTDTAYLNLQVAASTEEQARQKIKNRLNIEKIPYKKVEVISNEDEGYFIVVSYKR